MRARHGAGRHTTSRRRIGDAGTGASRTLPAGLVAAGVLGLSFLAPVAASAAPLVGTPTASATSTDPASATSASASASGTVAAFGTTTDAELAAAQQQLAALQERASRIDSDYVRAQVRLDAVDAAAASEGKALAAARQQVGDLQHELAGLTLTQVSTVGVPVQLVSNTDAAATETAALPDRLAAAQRTVASISASLVQDHAQHDQIVQLHAHQQALASVYEQRIATQQNVVDQLTDEDAAARQQAQQEQNVLAQRIEQAQAAVAAGAQAAPTSVATAPAAQPTATTTVTVTMPETTVAGSVASSSSRVATAIKFAMAQQGKPYVMGGTGPSTFDCSGLMLRAWEAAGIELPRTSQEQIQVGTPVKTSDLQPGDLVFYYPGVTHVGMYIGNGLIINAENSRVGIIVTRADSMPIVGARRIA